MVKLTSIKGLQLDADAINTKLGLQKEGTIKLTFTPDRNNTTILNPFSDLSFFAEDSGEDGYVNIYNVKGTDTTLLYVDTAYTNVNGAKFLAFNHD